jgi:hypothetical protein
LNERGIPDAVADAARRRSEARAEGDWATADRLRVEIEADGWRVVDSGTDYRLERASPPDLEVEGEIRYGRSDAVPSLLGDPATGFATVVLVASPDSGENRRCVAGLVAGAPAGVDVVVVVDGVADAAVDRIATGSDPVAVVRTSARLGQGAALNIGIRRSQAPVVVVIDPSIAPTGDLITPLVEALADPTVAVAGPFGLLTTDMQRFEEVAGDAPREAAAIEGSLMAFRRADAAVRGPLDEGFRFPRHLDIWWSLMLRDEGDDRVPRRALVVPGLPFERAEQTGSRRRASAHTDRLAKRNFYRVLDRFRTRLDLAVPGSD